MKFEPVQLKGSLLKPINTGEGCACTGIKTKTPADINTEYKNISWFIEAIETPAGAVPKISTSLSMTDRISHARARISSFRMKFSLKPGLYAAGNPDSDSDIFVTANYKLSFDHLRNALNGINAWILLLDTAGINVWCAAGKGTFGTDELIKKIKESGIEKCVNHKRIILPQLGAPGIDSGEVRKRTGFRVNYGPVRAEDIPEYINNGYRADRAMRLVRFSITDRAVLIPIEINMIKGKFLISIPVIFLYSALKPEGIIFNEISGGYPLLIAGILSILAGAVLTPLFLPFIPFKAFTIKGGIAGASLLLTTDYLTNIFSSVNIFLHSAILILFTLIASYLALQFTGSTTYTSLSGVKKEIRYSLPVYITGLLASAILLVISKITEWGYL